MSVIGQFHLSYAQNTVAQTCSTLYIKSSVLYDQFGIEAQAKLLSFEPPFFVGQIDYRRHCDTMDVKRPTAAEAIRQMMDAVRIAWQRSNLLPEFKPQGPHYRFDYECKHTNKTFFLKASVSRDLWERELEGLLLQEQTEAAGGGSLATPAQTRATGGGSNATPAGSGGSLATQPAEQDPNQILRTEQHMPMLRGNLDAI